MCAKASIHCIPKKKSIKTLHFEWAVLQGFNWFWHFGHGGRHSIEIYNLFIMSMKSNWSICKSIFVYFENHKTKEQKKTRKRPAAKNGSQNNEHSRKCEWDKQKVRQDLSNWKTAVLAFFASVFVSHILFCFVCLSFILSSSAKKGIHRRSMELISLLTSFDLFKHFVLCPRSLVWVIH